MTFGLVYNSFQTNAIAEAVAFSFGREDDATFGSIAMGIGTSEVEHVMATQTLSLKPFKTMAIEVSGELAEGGSARSPLTSIARVF